MEEILKMIRDALKADQYAERMIESFSNIDGEPGVIGVELRDGREVFIKVEPA